jgi:LacI family transcriptional regulator
MPVTMKDIARDLGVSVVTISKVLRNHSDIGEETRKRVLERVKAMNYRPNLSARGLVTGRSYLVGLVVPDLLHPFFAQIAKSLSKSLLKKGYCLVIATSDGDPQLERQEIDQLLGRGLDALVIASSSVDGEILKRIDEQGPPYILIDRSFASSTASFVGVDDVAVGKMATEHLIQIGCERIAHIRGPATSTGIDRLKGYKDALAKHRIPLNEDMISAPRTTDVESFSNGTEGMERLLELKPRPDAVFCYNDPAAIGAIDAILRSGLRVPEDIAVVGCGNLHYNSYLRIPLSSVDQHTDQIGAQAARVALSLLETKGSPRRKVVLLQPELIVRTSSKIKRSTAAKRKSKA